jgi:hypothetical protein
MPETAFFPADLEENVKEWLQPWQLLLLVLAGWVNRQQQDVIEYLRERNHQGMDNRLLIPGREVGEKAGEIMCRELLGGLLRYYYRHAA